MDTASPRNTVSGDELWDQDGRLWMRRHTAWLSVRAADRWVRRGQPVAVLRPLTDHVEWLDAEAAAAWWQHGRHHVTVPGSDVAGQPDEHGLTWGAHVWRCGRGRRVGFSEFC